MFLDDWVTTTRVSCVLLVCPTREMYCSAFAVPGCTQHASCTVLQASQSNTNPHMARQSQKCATGWLKSIAMVLGNDMRIFVTSKHGRLSSITCSYSSSHFGIHCDALAFSAQCHVAAKYGSSLPGIELYHGRRRSPALRLILFGIKRVCLLAVRSTSLLEFPESSGWSKLVLAIQSSNFLVEFDSLMMLHSKTSSKYRVWMVLGSVEWV
jgi:hypothetical protein